MDVNPRNYATFGIINGRHKVAGALIATAPGVAKRRWRSLAMGSYTQLSFTEQVKRCSWCGEQKPLTDFHRSKAARDGHKAHCKACGCADTRKWIATNREDIGRRRRARRLERRDEINAGKREWYAANREACRRQGRERYPLRAEQVRARARAWYYANPERARAARKAWREANEDYWREQQRRYREENKEVICERKRIAYHRDKHKYEEKRRAYQEANRERSRQRAREYHRKFPERVRFHNYARKARKGGPPDAETVAFSKVLRCDLCSYCGGPAGTLDHIVPLSKGGLHHWSNLTAACMSCNTRKKTMSALTFLYRSNRRSEG